MRKIVREIQYLAQVFLYTLEDFVLMIPFKWRTRKTKVIFIDERLFNGKKDKIRHLLTLKKVPYYFIHFKDFVDGTEYVQDREHKYRYSTFPGNFNATIDEFGKGIIVVVFDPNIIYTSPNTLVEDMIYNMARPKNILISLKQDTALQYWYSNVYRKFGQVKYVNEKGESLWYTLGDVINLSEKYNTYI